MNHLLILFSLIFLLATLVGIELGFWLARRKAVDVTEAYNDLRLANARSDASNWNRLWQQLDAMPGLQESHLFGINERIECVEQRLVAVTQSVNATPQLKARDLEQVHNQLNKIGKELSELRVADAAKLKVDEDCHDALDSTDEMPALVL